MNDKLIDIIKRDGKRPTEGFKKDKLHSSVYAACLGVRTPDGEAAHIAERVCTSVMEWSSQKPKITSNDIRRVASSYLATFHPEAAYFYQHHRLVM